MKRVTREPRTLLCVVPILATTDLVARMLGSEWCRDGGLISIGGAS